jgi:hypothetical protein
MPKPKATLVWRRREAAHRLKPTYVVSSLPSRSIFFRLTRALWAVAPDFKVENLGELKIKNGSGTVASVTVLLQFA